MYPIQQNYSYVHGSYVNKPENTHDAAIICIKNVNEPYDSKLQIIRDPQIPVYVTKKGLRTFTEKREYMFKKDLDMYICPYRDMSATLFKALNGFRPSGFVQPKKLLQSPYVYGCDAEILSLIKAEYLENCQKTPKRYSIGIFDLETSVLGGNEILCASYSDWNTRTTHAVILKSWYGENKSNEEIFKELNERYDKEIGLFEDGLNDKARKVWSKNNWNVKWYILNTEKDLIFKLFEIIHSCKPEFCGAWNIGYDIPYIIERCKFLQIDTVQLFAHPDVPEEFRKFEWNADELKDLDHFTDKWPTIDAPGYTYWYDAMCLYSRLRKVVGREVMYTLDYIGNKNIGTGKMHFGSNATHYQMQTNDICGYCVYNCIDTLIPSIMDAITDDVSSMIALCGPSLITDFAHQTVQLKTQFYEYCKSKGAVPGTVCGSIAGEHDYAIGNVGGAVLNPSMMKDRGSKSIEESDDSTSLYKLAADIDVSSFYPSLTIAFNISRETKYATVVWVEGCPFTLDDIKNCDSDNKRELMRKENAEYIDQLFGAIPTVMENAISLAHRHFKLPNYEELLNDYVNTKNNLV